MELRKYFELHLIVFLWGFTAILGVLISIPTIELVLYRTLGSALSIALLLKVIGVPLKIDRKDTLRLIFTGFLFSIHWILFFGSARISNVSVLLVGMSTVTFWTAVFQPVMYRGKIRIFEIVLGVIIVFGVYFAFRADFTHVLGFTMAIISAICAAIFTILNARFVRRNNHYQVIAYEMAGAFLGTLLFLPFYFMFISDGKLQFALSITDGLYIGVLVIVCTLYAYSASVRLMKSISPFMVNLTITLEPIYGILLALLIFGESEIMDTNFYIGSLIILFAVIGYPIIKKKYSTL